MEIPNIQKQRKHLAKLVLDMDSSRTRYSRATLLSSLLLRRNTDHLWVVGGRVCDCVHTDTPVWQALEVRAVSGAPGPLTEAVVQLGGESWAGEQPHHTISGIRESHEEMTRGNAGRDAGGGGSSTS